MGAYEAISGLIVFQSPNIDAEILKPAWPDRNQVWSATPAQIRGSPGSVPFVDRSVEAITGMDSVGV